ncbi:uroporphyrinogen-III synthase, partial [Paenibacillus sp. TAF58]
LQGLLYLDESAIEQELLFCVNNKVDWFVFTTGTGADTLLGAAEQLGIHSSLIQKVKEAKVAARGYKTYALLKKLTIKPEIVDEDGTTQGLIRSMNLCDLTGKTVVVQLHGEPQPELIQFLENRGATVIQLLPYRHVAPESSTVQTLCNELSTRSIDAVCFTTAVQVRYLFDYAKRQGITDIVRESFNTRVKAVAVGKVTEEALKEEGLDHVIVPESERMGAMVIELVKYYENQYLP